MDWDNLGQTLSGIGKDVADKMKETADVIVLKQKISSQRYQLKDAYEAIGRRFCEKASEEEKTGDYIDLFTTLDDIQEKIRQYKGELAALRKQKTCDSCGAVMGKSAKYCPQCGEKCAEEETDEAYDIEDDDDVEFDFYEEPVEEAEEAVEEAAKAVEEAAEEAEAAAEEVQAEE